MVPKFGSFKPKTAPLPEKEKPESSPKGAPRGKEEEADLDRRERKSHRDDGDRKRRHRPRHELQRSRSPAEAAPVGKTRSKESPDEHGSRVAQETGRNELFFFDKKGDPLILRYGTNDRSRVPSYRRFGRGKLMGAARRFEIHQTGPKEEWSLREYRDIGSVFRDRRLMAQLARSSSRRIRRETDGTPRGDEDFIQLIPSRKRKREEEEEAEGGLLDQNRPDYRSIEGKAKPEDFVDSDSESDDDLEETTAASDRELSTVRSRSIQLSRRVRDHPEETDSWLELIRLQDDLLRESEDDRRVRTQDEIKGLAELKISLFEKALSNAPTALDRERLLLGLMCEGRKVWDEKTRAKRWLQISETEEASFKLWRARLNFELTSLSSFSYEGVRQFLIERMQLVKTKLLTATGDDVELLSRQAIYVFLRLTRFLSDSGFSELAVAAWQTLLEMTFSRPDTAGDPKTMISSFRDFWESEVPRIGEDGARGWAHFADAEDMAEPPDPKENQPAKLPETRDQYKAWATLEESSAGIARIPARTLDEGVENDPYRVVMFSDIEEFLLWLPSSIVPEATSQLQDSFLLFCRLPPAFASDEFVRLALDDPFITDCREAAEALQKDSTAEALAAESIDLSSKRPLFTAIGSRVAMSADILFSPSAWFHYLQASPRAEEQIDTAWMLSVTKHLVRVRGFGELAEYYLALEWVNEPASARKVSKALLKQYPSRIRLYNAYALIESANKNVEVSRKVLSSSAGQNLVSIPFEYALTWRGSDTNRSCVRKSSQTSENQLLWNSWAWVELEQGSRSIAMARLCQSVDKTLEENTGVSPSLLLKARTHFSSTRDFLLSSQDVQNSLHYAESLGLLEYLNTGAAEETSSSSQGDIAAALRSIEAFSQELTRRSLARTRYQEQLLQFASRLLYHHASHG